VTALPVSDVDRANGIQWQGVVGIGFISRYRVVVPQFKGSESQWAKITIPEPTIPFTPWRDDNFGVTTVL
jgi:hypothetical protein